MAPDPHHRRRIAPTATAAAVLLVGLGATAPVAAHAATPFGPAAPATSPSPLPTTEKGLKQSLKDLNDEAEKLTEKFNKTRVDYGHAVKAEKAATKYAQQLEAKTEPARARLAQLAAANYMSGSPDAIFSSGGTADGISDSAYLQQNQATAVLALQKQVDQAEAAEKAAQERTQQVEQAKEKVQTARKAAKAKVDEVMKRLDKLTTTHTTDPKSGLTATIKGSSLPAKMARKALTKLGRPYVWGAAGPSSFDCSGLVVWAYAQVGKAGLPHYTGDLYQLGTKVSRGGLRAGDLVYFGSDLHHMGIYVGGGKFLQAPQTGDVVKISKLSTRSDYAGANRIS